MQKFILILLLSFSLVGCNLKTDQVKRTAEKSDEMDSSQTRSDFNTFKSTVYPYQIQYPTKFVHDEGADMLGEQERINFTNSSANDSVSSFMLYTTKGILPDPQNIYIDKTGAQKSSGKYTLGALDGVYISLPNGQGQGEEGTPRIEVYAEKNGVIYGLVFRGTSNIDDEIVTQVLSTFKLTN